MANSSNAVKHMDINTQILSVHFNKLSQNQQIYNYPAIKKKITRTLEAPDLPPVNQEFLPLPKVKYKPDF